MDNCPLQITQHSEFVEIIPPDKIDSYTAYQIDKEFHTLMETSKKHILLDLSKTCYIGSAGFGILILLQKKLQEKDLNLILLNPSEFILKIMDSTKFQQFFNITHNRNDAYNILGVALDE